MRAVTRLAATAALVAAALGTEPGAQQAVAGPAGPGEVRESVAPGVGYRAFTVSTPHGNTRIHLVTADLAHPGVAAGLLYPGSVAAREAVSRMAGDAGAAAAVNGDFFDITEEQHPGVEATGAASGPALVAGRPLKGAVPEAQRFGWTEPDGDTDRDVFGVGVDGRARLGRLELRGHLRTPRGDLPLGGLNQYALPVGSIGAFTARWGSASRARAACGTDERREAPCTGDSYEVRVRHGRVAAVSGAPGRGPVAPDTTVLLGREAGARALRELTPGTPVTLDYRLASSTPVPFAFALGAYPLLRDHQVPPGLDDATAIPRTAVGIADAGRTLRLLSTDGREGTSSGLTLNELAHLLRTLHCTDAAYLDGGASATLATRLPGTTRVAARNNLDHHQERPVPNGIAVFSPH
ncbi:phosphodiester glycosidase family protein [Kitasatospora viridis]|uniref:Uncharacterized protein DUF2233 n=1 Tax=Kitasatospora viridis TaxID=281105 RepID=A0A561UL25_9ACTN|nr:phosphodiester glycosidase family protein [Kitasatospora viridis]TWG00063.1 uncharacterized protein DUF2233 [Kitasatospora viridis]